MKKYFIPLIITYLILCLSTSTNGQVQPQDTVKRISLQDLREFNDYLIKNTSKYNYDKLIPEQILSELYTYIERKRTQSIEKQIPKK